MRAAALFGLLLAIPLGMVGYDQITALQVGSRGTVPASVDTMFGQTPFIWLLIVVAVLVLMVTGAVAFFMSRR